MGQNSFEAEALAAVNRSECTQTLLKAISDRLSGRDDCKGIVYTVDISIRNGVVMTPLIYVFPNRHRRAESDKLDVLSYVHRYKLQNITLDQLEFGTYQYLPNSSNNSKRRWVRVQ